jgi:hypothetical protein
LQVLLLLLPINEAMPQEPEDGLRLSLSMYVCALELNQDACMN